MIPMHIMTTRHLIRRRTNAGACTCNGVSEIINVGASSKGAEDSVELAKKYPFVYAAVGIHPDEVGELDEEKCADSDSCVMKKKQLP